MTTVFGVAKHAKDHYRWPAHDESHSIFGFVMSSVEATLETFPASEVATAWNSPLKLDTSSQLKKLWWGLGQAIAIPGCEKILPGLVCWVPQKLIVYRVPQKLKDQHQKLWVRNKTASVKSNPDNPDTCRHFQPPNLSSCLWSTWLFVGWTLIHLLYMAPSHGSATSFPMRFDDGF